MRYIGINAPETHKKEGEKWQKVVEPYGEEAFIFNKDLVEGKTVKIELENRITDVYGRTLAYVFLNNELVNAKLLSQGLAFPYDISKSKYYALFRKAFYEALRNKRGLYKNVFYPISLNKHLGEYGWYREKINSIYYSDKTVIKTDYIDIHILKRPHSKDRGIKAGKVGYFYGKLIQKKERYILLSENPHHIFLE